MQLPPMSLQPTSAQMFGQVDVNRNGASPNGIAADLRTPVSATEKAAVPATAAAHNPWLVIAVVGLLYVYMNARDRPRKKK